MSITRGPRSQRSPQLAGVLAAVVAAAAANDDPPSSSAASQTPSRSAEDGTGSGDQTNYAPKEQQ